MYHFMIQIKRVYDPSSRRDGARILVERLWPRGITKQRASLELWLKDIAPSPELRRWFHHDPARWRQFKRRYWQELRNHSEAVEALKQRGRKEIVTLVYAARDERHNGALALKEFLEQ
jgi:uncharacterized protein YeaO (DUF488 family)